MGLTTHGTLEERVSAVAQKGKRRSIALERFRGNCTCCQLMRYLGSSRLRNLQENEHLLLETNDLLWCVCRPTYALFQLMR